MSAKPSSTFSELARVSVNFGADTSVLKINLLQKCSDFRFNKISEIKRYHDILLFMMAYAENKSVYSLAKTEMTRLCEGVKTLSALKKESLTNSGIAFMATQGTFSLVLMKWLITEFTNDVTIHSFDETGAHPSELLKYSLNEMEFELSGAEGLSKLKWLETASGTRNKKEILEWLITAVDGLPVSAVLKEQLFASMKLFISIQTKNPAFSRSFGSIPVRGLYFHEQGLMKKFDERALIDKKLPAPTRLNAREKEGVLSVARTALVLLNRETDPITYGTPKDLEFYDLEHGLSIALFSIKSELRLAIESYIGFMMFKNGQPMSYGGAWLFGKRSLIGINIFEAFRGGESAFVFAQLLRTYKQAFGAEQFEVEPYQFGKNNPEGLRSGAFWFYHRFGFRPLDKKLSVLAEQEHQKIMAVKGYRTGLEVLKQFTKSNLGVNFGKDAEGIKPALISHFITRRIAVQFKGNRHKAFEWSHKLLKQETGIDMAQLTKHEKQGLIKLGLFVAMCLDLKKMNAAGKKTLLNLIKQKGSSEFEYAKTCRKFSFEKYFMNTLREFKV
jgi:hypothetical protein